MTAMYSLRTALAALVLSLALVALSPPVAGAALPQPVRGGDYALREVGRGNLTWLGFGVYEASLWSGSGRFAGLDAPEPMALSLWYQRKFTRAQLIDITTGEWERLGLADANERARWKAQLERIWSDVKRGDNMTAVVLPGRETRFYDAGRLMGRIEDPGFGRAYLAIWLDPRTAVRDLRTRLLGPAANRTPT